MKTTQLIIRMILSPFVFLFLLFGLFIFPGFMLLIMGIITIIGKLLGIRHDDSYKELLELTFMFIIYPILSTKSFIIHAKLLE